MTGRKAPWAAALVLAAAAGLPVAAHWLRGPRPPGCALDGQAIDPAYRVTVEDARGETHAFCCVRCARLWLDGQTEPPRSIRVTDEAGGGMLDAASAYFVRSEVVTNPATGNRIHAFRSPDEARKHAQAAGGALLTGAERPFP